MRKLRTRSRVTRRTFIKGAAAAGVALAIPPWIGGCGGGDGSAATPPQPVDLRERRTLHFDLSHYSANTTYILEIRRSRSSGVTLSPHTAATRARFRQGNPVLTAVADEHLTHFVENVDLPAAALQHILIRNRIRSVARADDPVVLTFLHFPSAGLASLAQRNLNAVRSGASPYPNYVKLRAYGMTTHGAALGTVLSALESDPVTTLTAIADFVTPLDTAKTLAFHHPELVNFQPDLGALVGQHIDMAPDLAVLGESIVDQGPATTGGGWFTLVPLGFKNKQGTEVYDYRLSDTTLQTSAGLVHTSLRTTKDDAALSGTNWHPKFGLSSVAQPPDQQPGVGVGPAVYELDYPVGSVMHGVGFDQIEIDASRNVTLNLDNRYLRFLGLFVQYFDADGNQLPFMQMSSEDTDNANWVLYIPTNDDIMGIPFQPPLDTAVVAQFSIPSAATMARLIFGSLGGGGLANGDVTEGAIILTSLIDYGIPSMMLLAGTGEQASDAFTKFTSKQAFLTTLIGVARTVVNDVITNAQLSVAQILEQIGELLGKVLEGLVMAGLNALIVEITAIIAGEEIEDVIPVVGWIARLAAVAATTAELLQTTIESFTTPARWHNDLSFTMSTQVTVTGDRNANGVLPMIATNYTIRARYGQKVIRTISGPITNDQFGANEIVETFLGVPEGGVVQIEVWLYTADDWVAGYVSTLGPDGHPGPVANFPATAGNVMLALTECDPPLTAVTTYQHRGKLMQPADNIEGGPIWQFDPIPPAPTATRYSLDCDSNAALCELNGITVSESISHVAYAWRGMGQPIASCAGNGGTGLYVFQDVFNTGAADATFVACGFERRAGVAYDLLGPGSGLGNNFFLQPGIDPRTHLPVAFVRQTVVTEGMTDAKFNLHQTVSWGQFVESPDSIAVHPAGYLIGINRARGHLEIISLEGAQPDAMAVHSWVRAGRGTRVGLLSEPVAVAVTRDGALLVLEQGNDRVQAFDLFGNPLLYFGPAGGPLGAVAPLRPQAEDVTYLDLAVEAKGYIFILYYLGEGATAADYYLDIYQPDGTYLVTTQGLAAGRIAIDFFRNIYSLNYELMVNSPRPQPTISLWVPSVRSSDASCGPPLPTPGSSAISRVRP